MGIQGSPGARFKPRWLGLPRLPRRPVARSFAAAALGLAAGAFLVFTGQWDSLERPFADLRARISAAPGRESGRIGLIYIDQGSLDWAEDNLALAWPWPRETYGVMADFCGKADALVFDVLFTERSPYGTADDARLSEAVERHGRVVMAASGATGSVISAPGLAFGSARALPDSDGVVRRYMDSVPASPAAAGVDSLGLAAVKMASGADAGATPGAGLDSGFGPAVPRMLRYRGRSPAYRAWSAAEILQAAMAAGTTASAGTTSPVGASVKPNDLKGMIVFVGMSAPGLLDRVPSPVDPAMPGAEVHATYADNLLSGDFLREPGPWAVLALCVAAALAAAFSILPAGKPIAQAALSALSFAAPPAAAFVAYRSGLVLPVVTPVIASAFSTLGALALAYAAEGRQRAYLRGAFGQYLSHEVIESLLRDPAALRLGGERKRITVLFTDVQDFTSLSEGLDPARLTAFMNEYLGVVTEAILDEGGTVDKYVGDAVVAFWNAPLAQPDHADRALRAAASIQVRLSRASDRLAALCGSAPATRIGVHTGDASVGNMGSRFRFNYSALGDAVNLASRLEGANKALGTRILCSGDTVRAAAGEGKGETGAPMPGAPSVRRLGLLKVVGRESPCEVWEVLAFGTAAGADPWEGVRTLGVK